MLHLLLRLFHVLSMAVWVGTTLFLSGDIKRTLQAGPDHLPLLKDRVDRSLRIGNLSGVATLVSGVALVRSAGGFGAVPPAVHSGLLGAIILFGVSAGGLQRTWRKLEARLDGGADATSLVPQARKLHLITKVFQTIWLIVLCLMVFRNGPA